MTPRSTVAPRRLRPAFERVCLAPHYASAVQALTRLSTELLARGQTPAVIASDLQQLVRPELRCLVDEVVSMCALRQAKAQ